MNNIDFLNDSLQNEIKLQSMYNRYMLVIQNPEVRQMLMQMRDKKMQNITILQIEIKKMLPNQ